MYIRTTEQEFEHQFSLIKQYAVKNKIDPKLVGDMFSIGSMAAGILGVTYAITYDNDLNVAGARVPNDTPDKKRKRIECALNDIIFEEPVAQPEMSPDFIKGIVDAAIAELVEKLQRTGKL